jgi:pimeloyl-ACP methyl ester carboxylesterase
VDDLAQTIASLILNDSEEKARWITKWQRRPKDLLAEPVRCLLEREDLTDELGRITCPALVIHGTADLGIPMDRAEALAAGLTGCRGLVAIEGAPHAANMTHPDQVNRALSGFLHDVAQGAKATLQDQIVW